MSGAPRKIKKVGMRSSTWRAVCRAAPWMAQGVQLEEPERTGPGRPLTVIRLHPLLSHPHSEYSENSGNAEKAA